MSAVNAADVLAGLKLLASFNLHTAIATFESGSVQDKVIEGEIALDVVLKIIGLAVPPVAIAANYLDVAITVEKLAIGLYSYLKTLPPTVQHVGGFEAFGQHFDGTIFQGDLK